MKNFSNEQIKLLAEKVVSFISTGNNTSTIQILKPLLNTKYPFPKLDLLGKEISQSSTGEPDNFLKILDEIVDYNVMGGFVVVGQALIPLLENDFEKVMTKSREYIVKGDKWYVCNIIGERSLGQALVKYFDKTLPWFEHFLKDENKWVKRSVGVAIHFFSKRVLTEPDKTKKLLNLIEPNIEEKQTDVVKGIGWGLKTIGRYHPDILVQFLKKQLKAKKRISKLMMNKAMTYLDKDEKEVMKNYIQNL